jgi:hypothetical protein
MASPAPRWITGFWITGLKIAGLGLRIGGLRIAGMRIAGSRVAGSRIGLFGEGRTSRAQPFWRVTSSSAERRRTRADTINHCCLITKSSAVCLRVR